MVDRPSAFSDVDDVPTIAQLINSYRDRTGYSYRDMADHAEREGYHIKYQTIAQLARTPPKAWPKQIETISALAVALGRVHERTVVIAYAKSLGIDVGSSDALRFALPRDFALIPREQQLRILGIVGDLVEMVRKAPSRHLRSAADKRKLPKPLQRPSREHPDDEG